MIRTIMVVAVSLCVAASGSAELVDFGGTQVDIEGWYGTGDNESILVVDFGAASYAFGYLWSDTVTSFEMLEDVAAESSFEFTYTDYDAGPEISAALNTLSYDGYTIGAGGWPNDWLAYWLSDDGTDWTVSGVGVSDNTLTDGSWDGWAPVTQDIWPPTTAPVTPVPEPGTMLLFLAGGAVAAARRLRKSDREED